MIDMKWIRENSSDFHASLKKRRVEHLYGDIMQLDQSWRELQSQLDDKRREKNAIAKEIGSLKSESREKMLDDVVIFCEDLIQQSLAIGNELNSLEETARNARLELDNLLYALPNMLDESVPVGTSENDNVLVKEFGSVSKLSFQPQSHDVIGVKFGLRLDEGVKLSGSRFAVLRGDLAKLERALANFMLDLHVSEHEYEEISVPILVREESMHGSGQLPKFADDAFCTTDGKWLIPTAEVSLINLIRDCTFLEAELPKRYVAYTPCFRAEAGASGRKGHGLTRLHQFQKVELVSITSEAESWSEHEYMLKCTEKVLQLLQIPYRIMLLCSGDTGAVSRKTYDIEVWLPGEKCYREISSCSNCETYQSRRLNAKYIAKKEAANQNTLIPNLSDDRSEKKHVHTLNSSGVAVGRCLIAVLENYQNSNGAIRIPDVLKTYMGNRDYLQEY
jgi:seryl-tRNA synthetase